MYIKNFNFKFYLTGLSILAVHLSIYYWVATFGMPAFISMTLMSSVLDWVLWDPKILFFRLQGLGLSCVAAGYSIYKRDWEGLKQLVKTQVVVGVITEILKNVVGRMRPNGSDFKSFPSGHASAAFTAAAYVHQRYGLSTALPVYVGASVVGCVRVYKLAHYPSDVIAGAGIAILTAYQMTTNKHNTNSQQNQYRSNLRLQPT